jgi:hypothetical protein
MRINYEKINTNRRMWDGVLWAYNCGELHTLRPDYIKRQEEIRCVRKEKKIRHLAQQN